ncbi:MAG: cation-transporting P-type ATPase [Pseudobdellovibrionaceae bacterium]|nr:cation-transporting P-type ATPase [Bdellovibrionales bacterium]USN47739.1 MAG: cation-transporting P-type ATPase [Pseudobdellovibrionaceae bacterium]
MMLKEQPWVLTVPRVLDLLEVDKVNGLTAEQVKERNFTYGINRITTQAPPSLLALFFRQFKSILVGLLALAALVAALSGDVLDAAAIGLVLLINSVIGFITEVRAISSMESLRKIGQTHSRVVRAGEQTLTPAEDLVPGDILILEAGDVVTADCRIIESHNLNVDESALTGESVPVEKKPFVELDSDTNVSDRQNMLMKGTYLTRGVCRAVVTHIGMGTEIGKIAKLTASAEEEITPLEKRLDRLGRRLVVLTLFVSMVILISGLLTGKDTLLMIQTAIALAVATVPEGLPIVATIALARGLLIMSRKNALVNKLSAVETLGATSIIVTDKTGTLTENNMTLVEVVTEEGPFTVSRDENTQKINLLAKNGLPIFYTGAGEIMRRLIEVVGLCNDAHYNHGAESFGDPMEVALLRFSKEVIGDDKYLNTQYPRVSEVPFDSHTNMMATIHNVSNEKLVAVKGAPESVISRSRLSDEQKEAWRQQNRTLAERGLRVLAIAYKSEYQNDESVFDELELLGLVGLIDPARQDVPRSISQCHSAGIKVVMATGDQAGTALKIAKDIGLPQASLEPVLGKDLTGPWTQSLIDSIDKTSVFSRVSPEQKLQLVTHYQKQGAIVAMTGDGVNDAPALKKADIGIAMGQRGTQVAREAADMILKDDRFETIVYAVEQGRIIFSNIRKFVTYLLSCNISEVFIVGIAAVFSTKIPVTPLQILFLNLVTDVFPALALGMGNGDRSYLSNPPRKSEEKIIEKSHWYFIFLYGILITASVLAVFYLCLYLFLYSFEKVVTISFLTLGMAQVFHVFNLSGRNSNVFINEITKNPHVWGAVMLCVGLLVASVHVPFTQEVLDLLALSKKDWILVLGFSLLPSLGQLVLRMK